MTLERRKTNVFIGSDFSSAARQQFKRGVSFNAADAADEQPVRTPTTPPPILLSPPPSGKRAVGGEGSRAPSGGHLTPVAAKPKSNSFSVKPPPPRRLSWFSSPGEARAKEARPARAKSRTMSIDQGPADGEPDGQQPAPASPFGVLNHLRSSFKHYTSKGRNKEIA